MYISLCQEEDEQVGPTPSTEWRTLIGSRVHKSQRHGVLGTVNTRTRVGDVPDVVGVARPSEREVLPTNFTGGEAATAQSASTISWAVSDDDETSSTSRRRQRERHKCGLDSDKIYDLSIIEGR